MKENGMGKGSGAFSFMESRDWETKSCMRRSSLMRFHEQTKSYLSATKGSKDYSNGPSLKSKSEEPDESKRTGRKSENLTQGARLGL